MFKKLRWFLFYRRTIRKNRTLLLKNHGIKIDWINRMYKTYTLTDNDIEEIKSFGGAYLDKLLEKDKSKIEESLLELKIHQFVGLMEVEQLNNRQIGIAFRFKYFDTARIANAVIWLLLSVTSMGISYLLNPRIISIAIGLLVIFGIYLISRLFVVNRVIR